MRESRSYGPVGERGGNEPLYLEEMGGNMMSILLHSTLLFG